jgi:deoxycytidylate deaminase
MAACLIQNKKLVGHICSNLDRTIYHKVNYGSLHAEARTLLAYFGKRLIFNNVKNIWCLSGKRAKIDIFVLRINKLGIIGNSRPCYHCLQMMKSVGVKKIYYTTGVENEIIVESIKDMLSIQASYATKIYDKKKYNTPDSQYIETLFIKYIPLIIKYENLQYFIKYNYNIYCNNFTYKYVKKNNNLCIYFYNAKNSIIKISQIQ